MKKILLIIAILTLALNAATLKENRTEYRTIGDKIAKCIKDKKCTNWQFENWYKQSRHLNLQRVKIEDITSKV